MIKVKSWLEKIHRVPNTRFDRGEKFLRLDKSERMTKFEDDFFKKFISSIKQEDIMAYPETALLTEKLAAHHDVSEKNIFLVPGADAAIKAFFEIAISSGDEVIITKPCFPMYFVYSALFNAKVVEVPYKTLTSIDHQFLIDSIKEDTKLVALANPNSPIGDFTEIDIMEQVVKKSHKFGIPVLIDEAYYEYAPGTAIGLIKKYENVGIARTFSKAFGGAGVRVGYVVGSESIIEKLAKWRLMYEVNQIGLKYAMYALENIAIAKEYAEKTIIEREIVINSLMKAGYDVVPSKTNWIHFHGKEKNEQAVEILKRHNVLFKTDSRIPFDDRSDWIRLNMAPDLSQVPFMIELLSKGD